MATVSATVNGTTVQLPLQGDTGGVAGATAIWTLLGLLFNGVGQVNGSVPFTNIRSANAPLAASGTVQLGPADQIAWRDPTDTYDVSLGPDAYGNVAFGRAYSPFLATASVTGTWGNVIVPGTQAGLTPTYDPSGTFANNVFTAPATGVYLVQLTLTLQAMSATAGYVEVSLGYIEGELSSYGAAANFFTHKCSTTLNTYQPCTMAPIFALRKGQQIPLTLLAWVAGNDGIATGVMSVRRVG
jgi:hypothetical protein